MGSVAWPCLKRKRSVDALGRVLTVVYTWREERARLIERDLADLKQHVAALQSRIEEIEQRLAR